ncbi:hypothetical protein FF1_014148 [Malus domestica]
MQGFPGMIGSINWAQNDLNVPTQSPVFNDVLQGKAPRVMYWVNENKYRAILPSRRYLPKMIIVCQNSATSTKCKGKTLCKLSRGV